MDVEIGAPLFRAVITKKSEEADEVKLWVRYHRKSFFDDRRKEFEVVVKRDDKSQYQMQRYQTVKHLEPGDLIYVDVYGEDFTDPLQCNVIRRKWNLFIF